MKRTPILLLVATCCFSFQVKPTVHLNPDDLTGKWKFVQTKHDGIADSTANNVKEYYYEFRSDKEFILSYRHNDDTTLYRIGGKYSVNAKNGIVRTKYDDKGHTRTRYTVQALDTNELVLVSKGDSDKTYTTYFEKVK